MFGNAEMILRGISNKGEVLFQERCRFVMEDNTAPIVFRDEICALVRKYPSLVRVVIDIAI